jgi:hypothetical protein
MATARHQQTNGGAKSMVKLSKQVMKGVDDYSKTNWTSVLRETQFAINNSVSSTTGFTQHYLAHAFQPSKLGDEFRRHYRDLELAHRFIYKAQVSMVNDYNRSSREGFTLVIGSQVLLERKGIAWSPDSARGHKLMEPFLGPFVVTAIDEDLNNVTLNLPSHMRIHPVFHISKLRDYVRPDTHFPARVVPLPLTPASSRWIAFWIPGSSDHGRCGNF